MALRQGEAGTPVADICRKLGIGQATYSRWRKAYGSLGVSELRELPLPLLPVLPQQGLEAGVVAEGIESGIETESLDCDSAVVGGAQ